MKRKFWILLLLLCLLPLSALAANGWTDAVRLNPSGDLRYGMDTPAYMFGNPDWKLRYRYSADLSDPNAFFFEVEFVDPNGSKIDWALNPDVSFLPAICVPFPDGHDISLGYDYIITKKDTGTVCSEDPSEYCIIFRLDQNKPFGTYRVSWDPNNTPIAVPWDLLMTRMDWSGSSCQYTVGAGSKQVSVSRNGSDVRISGGEISGTVRFVVNDQGEDYQSTHGWHVKPGRYTFHNVTLPSDFYIWAYNGENYQITLDASVKGSYGMICALKNGASLDLINNDIIYSDRDYSMIIEADTDSRMSITGNGKILIGEGWDWADESATSKDEVPVRVMLSTPAANSEEALRNIREFEGNVVVSYDQVKIADGYPPIRSYCMYMPDPNDPWYGADVIDPETGKSYELDTSYIVKKLRPGKGAMTEPVVAKTADLGEAALFRPLLLTSADSDQPLYLRSEITEEISGSQIQYEIHMVDNADGVVALSEQSYLYIPYPNGMDASSASEYVITIRHYTEKGVEAFTTQDGTILLTPYGLRIPVSSLSPFDVSWQTAQVPPANPGEEDKDGAEAAPIPPKTGDAMPLESCMLLAVLTGACLMLLKRRAFGSR